MAARRIELDLNDIQQLFNSMDPSPFHERDLDTDAEEFLVGWAQELPGAEPVSLLIHLKQAPAGPAAEADVERAVRNYFAYRTSMNRLELRRLLEQGRVSLLIGLAFLALCLFVVGHLGGGDGSARHVARESLTIAGWVAMWRPMQIYFYDWWPLVRRGRILARMSRMKVELRPRR